MTAGSARKSRSEHEAFRRLFSSLRGSVSYRALAERTNYDHSHLAKVERGERAPTRDLAEQLDRALGTRGELAAIFHRRPAQLPASAAFFVGRRAEFERIDEAVARANGDSCPILIALCGSPGVGKTSIALHWSREVAGQYPDGVLFADLRGYAGTAAALPSTVLKEFLLALGIAAGSIPEDENARASLYRSIVAGRRLLIVLDNAKDSAHVRPLLPGASDCVVLLTSRRRLSGLVIREGAVIVPVQPMDSADAGAIIGRIVGEDRVAAERQWANELVIRCSHLPLALRVAAERVARNDHRTLADLVLDLESAGDRLDFLSATEDDSTAVRVVFSWSYDYLAADTARMFRLLALHPGPDCGVAAAAALAGWSVTRTRHHLDLLISMHLLERTPRDRYQFHELTRAYALERAHVDERETDRRAAQRRLLLWCLAMASAANQAMAPYRRRSPLAASRERLVAVESRAGAASWCDEELAALTAIVRTAADWGFPEFAYQLPIAMWDHYCRRGASPTWLEMNEVGRVQARDLGDDAGHACMLHNLGHGWLDLRRFERAREYFDAALAIRCRIGDRAGQAWSLLGLGTVAAELGQHVAAPRLLAEAVEIFADLGDRWAGAVAIAHQAELGRRLGHADEARSQLEHVRSVLHEVGDHLGESYVLDMLGRPVVECQHAATARCDDDGRSAALHVLSRMSRQDEEHSEVLTRTDIVVRRTA